MRKKLLMLVMLLTVAVSGAWAAGYVRTLTKRVSVPGYKAKKLYNFQTNSPAVLPTTGDLRYRDEGGVWGLSNFGSGSRSAAVDIPVVEGDILVIQTYTETAITINCGTANAELSASTGYQVFNLTKFSGKITFTVPRYNGIVAALILRNLDNPNYELAKVATFSDGAALAIGELCEFKAYETGNARYQNLYVATAPEYVSGWMAFQQVSAGSGNGWWNRLHAQAKNTGLFAFGGSRSAAVFGSDLVTGGVVVFEGNEGVTDIANVMTLDNKDGNPDGTFTYRKSSDNKSYICTINASSKAYVGFCGNKSAGYIKEISVWKPAGEPDPAYMTTLDFESLVDTDADDIPSELLSSISDLTITDENTNTTMTISESDGEEANKYVVEGGTVLELNGGTLHFVAPEGYSIKKIIFTYSQWDETNSANAGVEVEGTGIEVDGKKAVWAGAAPEVTVTIGGKTVIKNIKIELGERLGEDVELDAADGAVLNKMVSDAYQQNPYVGKITLNLVKGGKYTVDGSVFIGRPLCINGAEGAVIDASKCEDPFVLMRPIGDNASLNAAGGYDVDSIAIKDVTIKGLKNRLVYADRHKYLIGKVLVSNSVIMVDGTTPRSIFDFYCGGNFKELIVENSTLAADPSNSKRGGLLSTQASQSVFALGGENQKISIKNSTLYNIAKGETPVLLERHSDADLTFELLNSVIVNSGEAGKFVLGLNEGQPGEECTWIIGNNSFTFDGKDTGRDEQYGNDDVVEGPITFSGADKGDFSLSVLDAAFEAGIGDPRWLNGAEGDLLVEVASGKDIAAEVAAAKGDKKPLNTLIRLAKDGKYTISGTIESAGNIVIKGDGTGLPTIDATALDAPFVTLDGTETAAKNVDGTENANYKSIGQVKISDLKIEGLSKPLVRDNQKTLVDNLQVQNAVVNMEGSANIFDFNGKGYPAALRVLESTLWSKGGHTGFFLQSSGRVKDLDSDQSQYTQMITVTLSTLYKISVGKQLNNLQGKGQKSLVLMLMNSIIAESTQAGNEVRGWLGGQNSTNPQTIYLFNSYWADGAVQAGWTDSSKQGYDMSETSIEGDPQFKNPAEGDFTLGAGTEQNQYGIGDPRWTVEYVPTAIEVVQTVKENANDGAWYTLQGVRVDKPAKGIYIHNGKKVVIK